MSYPTAKEIMSNDMEFSPEVIKAAKEWKAACLPGWKDKSPAIKFALLGILVKGLAELYNKPVSFRPDLCSHDHYEPVNKRIVLANASIVTALHELGHHLFGHSELMACRFSVHLFRKVFPKQFAKLYFDGHLLRRAYFRPDWANDPNNPTARRYEIWMGEESQR